MAGEVDLNQGVDLGSPLSRFLSQTTQEILLNHADTIAIVAKGKNGQNIMSFMGDPERILGMLVVLQQAILGKSFSIGAGGSKPESPS